MLSTISISKFKAHVACVKTLQANKENLQNENHFILEITTSIFFPIDNEIRTPFWSQLKTRHLGSRN